MLYSSQCLLNNYKAANFIDTSCIGNRLIYNQLLSNFQVHHKSNRDATSANSAITVMKTYYYLARQSTAARTFTSTAKMVSSASLAFRPSCQGTRIKVTSLEILVQAVLPFLEIQQTWSSKTTVL